MRFPTVSLPFSPFSSSLSNHTLQRNVVLYYLDELFNAPFVFGLALALLIVTLRWYQTRHREGRNRSGGRRKCDLPRWEPEAKKPIDREATFRQRAPSSRSYDRAQKAVWWADPVWKK
ncbi:hypothetical protein N7G274_005495 [Stereocaulon virgatum]|uniref:ATP synthase F0 subunit 8 n=1 Tax=Stereocaulon virgatum TaxID=373712 RepID=A0ABR4A8G7_9LECA